VKKLKLQHFLAFIYAVILMLWVAKIYKYYFDMDKADWSALVIILTAAFVLGLRLRVKLPQWISLVLVVAIPISAYPLISFLILYFNSAWTWLYVFLSIGVFLAPSIRPKWHVLPLLSISIVWFLPFNFLPDQSLYYERLIAKQETRKGIAHVVRWKNDFWLHYNKQLQFSTLDGHMYGEAYVHPAMSMVNENSEVLVIGGDNGLVFHELAKYPKAEISVIPFDAELSEFVQHLQFYNHNRPSLNVLSTPVFETLRTKAAKFDLIIIDMPEATGVNTNQYYTKEFYDYCFKALNENGLIVTQSGNPILNKGSFITIENTINQSGFFTTAYQAQIPTIGQWSWVIGSKKQSEIQLKKLPTETRWLDAEAMEMMLSFGKMDYYPGKGDSINQIKNPTLIRNRSTRL